MGVKVAEITKDRSCGRSPQGHRGAPRCGHFHPGRTDYQAADYQKSIPILTRPTQGVILIRLKETDKVAAVALTYKQVEDEE